MAAARVLPSDDEAWLYEVAAFLVRFMVDHAGHELIGRCERELAHWTPGSVDDEAIRREVCATQRLAGIDARTQLWPDGAPADVTALWQADQDEVPR